MHLQQKKKVHFNLLQTPYMYPRVGIDLFKILGVRDKVIVFAADSATLVLSLSIDYITCTYYK